MTIQHNHIALSDRMPRDAFSSDLKIKTKRKNCIKNLNTSKSRREIMPCRFAEWVILWGSVENCCCHHHRRCRSWFFFILLGRSFLLYHPFVLRMLLSLLTVSVFVFTWWIFPLLPEFTSNYIYISISAAAILLLLLFARNVCLCECHSKFLGLFFSSIRSFGFCHRIYSWNE